VANGFKTGGRDWKPGECGNLKGLALYADMKDVRAITPGYVRHVISKISGMSRDALVEYLKKDVLDGGPNIMEMAVAAVYMKAVEGGDHSRLNFLLDRSIGKVVEQKVVQVQAVTYRTSILPDGSLLQSVISDELGLGESGGEEDA